MAIRKSRIRKGYGFFQGDKGSKKWRSLIFFIWV